MRAAASAAAPPTNAAPIVKWAGGKTRLLDELIARVPSTFGRYFEPFAGGAALFFRLAPRCAVVADRNPDLISMYEAVSNHPEEVIKLLRAMRAAHCKSHYYATRDAWNGTTMTHDISRAATFIYLNKTCFNGLWRVNQRGEFNVPMGRYVDPPICNPDAIRAASKALSRAQLRCLDYAESIADVAPGDFVYLDPPYDGTFTDYTAGGFDDISQARLAANVHALVKLGCKVMVSNSDTPLIRRLYDGMRIDVVKCARAINSKADKRGAVDEVIITAGYEVAL